MAPNERGYCGPEDHRLLREALRAEGADGDLEALVRVFDGPLPYLRVIAESAGIDDVFDPRVVEAYWVGNDLLDTVDPDRCADTLLAAFAGAPTVDPRRIQATREGASPHHGYHVLVTYPWIDVVAAGQPSALGLLDSCRVGWGTLVSVQSDTAEVATCPMVIVDGLIQMGEEVVRRLRRIDRPDNAAIQPGDLVTVHWDNLCDRLSPVQADALRCRTATVIDLVNRCLLGGR